MMAFSGQRTTSLVILALFCLTTKLDFTAAETYECTVEEYGQEKNTYCVFRNVKYLKNTTDIAFKAPAEKQHRVVFEDSTLEHLPRDFLQKFGNDLKVLNVSGCKLRSVVITKSMEELYAIDNYISTVIVHQNAQNSPMKEIYLQSNRLTDISNITKNCKNVQILDLSRNQQLAAESELNLAAFNGFNDLQYLMLADVGALYLNYKTKSNLPSLTLLDLSMNSLLPSDLRVDYLHAFEKLETLRLNDNGFVQLDYGQLLDIKSLKKVYLEGNSFECDYLKKMIKFLNENDKETPVFRPARNCGLGESIEAQMCCRSGGMVHKPGPNDSTSTRVSGVTDSPMTNDVTTKRTETTSTPKANIESNTKGGVTKLHINLGLIALSSIMFLMIRE